MRIYSEGVSSLTLLPLSQTVCVRVFLHQWHKSLGCPRLTLLCPVPSSPSRHPALFTSCHCCCASDNAAVTCPSLRRYTARTLTLCSHKDYQFCPD